jgi:hypothetical protein
MHFSNFSFSSIQHEIEKVFVQKIFSFLKLIRRKPDSFWENWFIVYKATVVRIVKCSNRQVFESSSVRIVKCSNSKVFESSSVRTVKCSNRQMFEKPRKEVLKYHRTLNTSYQCPFCSSRSGVPNLWYVFH